MHRRRARSVGCALAVALAFSACAASAQTDEEKAAARSLARQGQEAIAAGKYADAIDLVTRAEALVHAPTHLLLIGRAQVALGRLVSAQETFLKIVRDELPVTASPAFKRAQQEAREELRTLEPKIPQLKIDVKGGAGQKYLLKMDDQPVPQPLIGVYRPVDPGKHALAVYATGATPVQQSIELAEGDKKDVMLPMPAPAPVPPPSNATDPNAQAGEASEADQAAQRRRMSLLGVGIAAAGLGAVGIVIGTIFVVKHGSTSSDADTLYNTCQPKGCTASEQDQIETLDHDSATQGTIGAVGLIGGGVLLAGGAVALVLALKKPSTHGAPPPPSGFVTPWVGPSSIGLRGAF